MNELNARNRAVFAGRPAILTNGIVSMATTASGATGWSGGGSWVSTVLVTGAALTGAGVLGIILWRRWAARSRNAASGPLQTLHEAEARGDLARLWSPAGNTKTSIFDVSTENGFLPTVKPLRKLPREFGALEDVVTALPRLLSDPSETALARAVEQLPQYNIVPSQLTPVELQSLFRDYAILASAYLLEGKTKAGKPRQSLPANLAVPFDCLARALDEKPIMSYDSYCLANTYSTIESNSPATTAASGDALLGEPAVYAPAASAAWRWGSLRLIRAFDGGAEETTFITVHAEIESQTPALLRAYKHTLRGLGAGSVAAVTEGLAELRGVLEAVIVAQLKMFNASDPRNYTRFVRPWIFGWSAANKDFPSGVIFEGVSTEPTYLRGETGAQSSIVPSLDIFFGVEHRTDALRSMLIELEQYRPAPQRVFLRELRALMWGRDVSPGGSSDETSQMRAPHALRDFVREAGDSRLGAAFNACVALLWAFRDIHVIFAELYIGRFTAREHATGGTPYRAYLAKHRAETLAHQLVDFPLAHWPTVSETELAAELTHVLEPSTVSGIPPHLARRHADIITRLGHGDESLREKRFPTTASSG